MTNSTVFPAPPGKDCHVSLASLKEERQSEDDRENDTNQILDDTTNKLASFAVVLLLNLNSSLDVTFLRNSLLMKVI